MTLLEVRCKKCGKLLREIRTPPTDWTNSFRYEACGRHGQQYQRRHDADAAAAVDPRVLGAGPLLVEVPYRHVRDRIERAHRTGRTSKLFV